MHPTIPTNAPAMLIQMREDALPKSPHSDPGPPTRADYEAALDIESQAERYYRVTVTNRLEEMAGRLEDTAAALRKLAAQTETRPTARGAHAMHELTDLLASLSSKPLQQAIRDWEITRLEVERLGAAVNGLLDQSNAN